MCLNIDENTIDSDIDDTMNKTFQNPSQMMDKTLSFLQKRIKCEQCGVEAIEKYKIRDTDKGITQKCCYECYSAFCEI